MQLSYQNGDKQLVLQPLKGEIDTDASDFTVLRVKVEIRLVKRVQGRWGTLEGDTPDGQCVISGVIITSSDRGEQF